MRNAHGGLEGWWAHMAAQEAQAGHAGAQPASGGSSGGERYTGVVVIHGLGIEQRNDTLQESLNALTYWFNHIAGLQYRPGGPGHIWVETHLTDDPDPDAPQSWASISMQAPESERPLRLEMREVWWAQSFGQPSVGHVLRWSVMQLLQVLNRLFLFNLDPTQPPRIGHRDDHQNGADPQGSFGGDRAPSERDGPLWLLLRLLLTLYDVVQYILNFVALVMGVGFVGLVLLLAVILDNLSWIPGMPSIVQGVQSFITLLSLHWLGSMQVFMEDYTVAATLRQRFQCEIERFLNDDHCDRIVAIAHSMGTVIAYEGLWTALEVADPRVKRKPITFVCLAQALSRLWRVARTEPHRLRISPLNYNVDWYEFWSRFDPVAAGPLTPSSLPPAHDWSDKLTPDPTDHIRKQLGDKHMHVGVINRDNIVFDHLAYWENLEQVVGPIARLLVAQDKPLTDYVTQWIATSHDVVARRARVAALASTALLVGGVALAALLLIDPVWQWIEQTFIAQALWALRQAIGAFLYGIVPAWGQAMAQVGANVYSASQSGGVGADWAVLAEFLWQNGTRITFAFTVAAVLVFLVTALLHRSPQHYQNWRAKPLAPGRY